MLSSYFLMTCALQAEITICGGVRAQQCGDRGSVCD